MPMLQVDLSEYDMLRNGKKQAEDTIEDLKKEIEEYKKNARVVVITKKCYRKLDFQKVARLATEFFTGSRDPMVPSYVGDNERMQIINRGRKMNLQHALECAVMQCDTDDIYHSSEPNAITSSSQVTGFDDVRVQVEEIMKKEVQIELDTKFNQAKEAKEKYEKKYAKVEQEIRDTVTGELKLEIEQSKVAVEEANKAALSFKNQLDAKEELLKKKNEEIEDLNTQIENVKNDFKVSHNYRAAAASFEKENLKLKRELEDLKLKNETLENELSIVGKPKKHWWNF